MAHPTYRLSTQLPPPSATCSTIEKYGSSSVVPGLSGVMVYVYGAPEPVCTILPSPYASAQVTNSALAYFSMRLATS